MVVNEAQLSERVEVTKEETKIVTPPQLITYEDAKDNKEELKTFDLINDD